jgi:hypothetical protein
MTAGEMLRKKLLEDYSVDNALSEALLDDIESEANLIAEMEDDIAKNGISIEGARGQRIANPLLIPLAKHRALLTQLLKNAFGESETEQQQRARRSRWQNDRTPPAATRNDKLEKRVHVPKPQPDRNTM